MIIDTHTHAFPDYIASIAIEKLENLSKTKSYLNGTTADLLRSMDRAGIEASIIACIATAPVQFKSILEWCQGISNPRLIPLPSIHPDSPDVAGEIRKIREAGFVGLKLHAEYQSFYLDEERMYPIYREAVDNDLLILFHCGHDISYPDSDRSSPARLARIRRDFPELEVVASHLGGWRQWDRVIHHLVGKNIYLDTSYTIGYIDETSLRTILTYHPPNRILFGTDSPWKDQQEEIRLINSLDVSTAFKACILGQNARELFQRKHLLKFPASSQT
jgi:predicted TIM-barrel fold metal-dependent hydrolase